jgi:hypothetical protein
MLTEKPMNRVDAWRMIQRCAADLGTRVKIGCHTFRATGITAYLEAGGGGRDGRHTPHRPPSRLMLIASVALTVVSMALVMVIAVMLVGG